jgi:SH3-like domain-containing protein
MRRIFSIIIFYFLPLSSYANFNEIENFPQYGSLKYHETNVRTGPSIDYPIKWIYQGNNIPLEILSKYNNWLKVKDYNGDIGWIHLTLLSQSRNFIVKNNSSVLYRKPGKKPIAEYVVDSNVRGTILSCRNNWCEVNINGIIGWLKKNNIWGVYDFENF